MNWYDSLPTADTQVPCGSGSHTVRWEAGQLTLPSHPDAEAELVPFCLGIADVVEHLGREEGLVDEIFGRVVEDLGVDEGEFGTTYAVGFHLLEFVEELWFFNSGSEPPPADHRAGVGWRLLELLLEVIVLSY